MVHLCASNVLWCVQVQHDEAFTDTGRELRNVWRFVMLEFLFPATVKHTRCVQGLRENKHRGVFTVTCKCVLQALQAPGSRQIWKLGEISGSVQRAEGQIGQTSSL